MLNLLYISLSGNTSSFVTRLSESLELDHQVIDIKQKIKENAVEDLEYPTVVFLPTYLEGGNGVDNGYQEIITTPLREFLRSNGNHEKVLGIVGSGNKNFNNQYILTAKQYAEEFGFPLLGDFELRGTTADLERIRTIIHELVQTEVC